MHLQVKRWKHEQGEERRSDQAADHHNGQRTFNLGAVELKNQ
jgi:hypothetical protein